MLFALVALATVYANDHEVKWSYAQHGKEWLNITKETLGNRENFCSEPFNQSPIDLNIAIPMSQRVLWAEDQFTKIYSDLPRSTIKWNQQLQASWLQYPKVNDRKSPSPTNGFVSFINAQRESATLWFVRNLLWRSQSEHTINGVRFDLELQVFHEPAYKRFDVDDSDQADLSALSILFSVDPLTATLFETETIDLIDGFFDE